MVLFRSKAWCLLPCCLFHMVFPLSLLFCGRGFLSQWCSPWCLLVQCLVSLMPCCLFRTVFSLLPPSCAGFFLSQRFSLWLYMRRLFGAGVCCNLLFMVSRSCCSFSLWCLATVIGTMLLYYYRHVKAFNTRNKLRFIFMSHAVNTWILIASRAQSSK